MFLFEQRQRTFTNKAISGLEIRNSFKFYVAVANYEMHARVSWGIIQEKLILQRDSQQNNNKIKKFHFLQRNNRFAIFVAIKN